MGTASGEAKQTATPTMSTPPGKKRPRWHRALIAAGAAILILVGSKLVDEALSRLAPPLLDHLPDYLNALRHLPLWEQALGILGIGAMAFGVAWLLLADRQAKKQEEAEQAEQGRAEQGKLLATHVAEPITTAVKEVVEVLKQQQPPAAKDLPPNVSVPDSPALPISTVPRQPTPYFTGREEALESLHATFAAGKGIVTQALTGLGGIGKTQTALEYAFRHQQGYQAVFWVQAETRELLIGDFGKIAALLQLPERDAQKQEEMVAAVRRWLETHLGWLLILDNVEDAAPMQEALPTRGSGHVLLTTRAQVPGAVAQRTDLKELPSDEAALFLLRRAGILALETPLEAASPEQQAGAIAIADALGHLPLALDQAGAYIDETGFGLKGYLDLYRQQRRVLLRLRGASHHPELVDHPESVAVTWNLAFKKVRQASPAAADLLRLCAFLHPETIPKDLFHNGADELPLSLQKAVNEPLRWNAALAALRRFSLIERQTETQTFSLHRLVQAVLQDALPDAARRAWAERAVRLVNAAFPNPEFEAWERCQQLLPHALVCADHIEQRHLVSPEAALLLNRLGYYLYERAQYAEALPRYQRSLAIREQGYGPNHPEVATVLNNLALLYHDQGRYVEMLPLLQRSLAIREQAYGTNHPKVATALHNLALFYHAQGRFAEALPCYQRELAILEGALGSDHPDVTHGLHNLAELYRAQGRYVEMLPLLQRSLAIREQAYGTNHPYVASSMNSLAGLYYNLGQDAKALPLHQRALTIREQALGPNHPDVAASLNNLAELYLSQGQDAKALPLLQRALAIWEQALGQNHPNVAIGLNNLANLYHDQGRYGEALPLYQRALAIKERALPPDHPGLATGLENLADLLRKMGQAEQAEALETRAQANRARRGRAGGS